MATTCKALPDQYRCPECGVDYNKWTVEFANRPAKNWFHITESLFLLAIAVLMFSKAITTNKVIAGTAVFLAINFLRQFLTYLRRFQWRIALAPDGTHIQFRRGQDAIIPWRLIKKFELRDEDGNVHILNSRNAPVSFSGITVLGKRKHALAFVEAANRRLAFEQMRTYQEMKKPGL